MAEHIRIRETALVAGDIAVSTVWKWIKTKNFPEPYKLAGRVTVWKRSEVEAWVEEQMQEAV